MEHFDLKEVEQYTDRLHPAPKTITTPEQLMREYRFDELTTQGFLAYGVGHFLNDLTASFWFKYAQMRHSASPSTF